MLGAVGYLVKNVGIRDLGGRLSCVVGIGSALWDRLSPDRRPKELRPFASVHGPVLAGWAALSIEEQEAIMGRTKLENIELDDDDAPRKSHKSLATIEDDAGGELAILRDNMPFGRPGAGEFGTYFIGYAVAVSARRAGRASRARRRGWTRTRAARRRARPAPAPRDGCPSRRA